MATTGEIVRLAREQMAAEGAASLSLRAIAREMGMVSSGIYRYYASRDELLTALIIDSYERLGAAAEEADRGVRRRGDHRARWRAMAGAIRQFALDSPSEWALLFGTPIPGYAAPADTIGPASRYTLVFVELLGDIARLGTQHEFTIPRTMRADLVRLHDVFGLEVPASTMALGLTAWSAIMGAVSLELFGHLHNVIDQPGALFDAVVDHYGSILAP